MRSSEAAMSRGGRVAPRLGVQWAQKDGCAQRTGAHARPKPTSSFITTHSICSAGLTKIWNLRNPSTEKKYLSTTIVIRSSLAATYEQTDTSWKLKQCTRRLSDNELYYKRRWGRLKYGTRYLQIIKGNLYAIFTIKCTMNSYGILPWDIWDKERSA